MKKLTIIVFIMLGFLLSSCNYDYEYPDTSNGFIEYKIVPNLSKETKEKFKSIAKQYDSTVGTYENHDIWAWDVDGKLMLQRKIRTTMSYIMDSPEKNVVSIQNTSIRK